MNSDIIIALIGAGGSALTAWLTSRTKAPNTTKRSPMPILALGLAVTALVIAVFNFSTPQFHMARTTITAHTRGTETGGESPLLAPNVPTAAQVHELNLECEDGYNPIAAWHEVTGSHPALDVMYSIDASVANDSVMIRLRAREGRRGYAYVDVLVLCSRVD